MCDRSFKLLPVQTAWCATGPPRTSDLPAPLPCPAACAICWFLSAVDPDPSEDLKHIQEAKEFMKVCVWWWWWWGHVWESIEVCVCVCGGGGVTLGSR